MKERAVALFLFAMGSIKVYENFSGEDEDDEFERDYLWSKGKSVIKKRSVEAALDRWRLRESEQALLEAVSGSALVKVRLGCTQEQSDEKSYTKKDCTCTRLICTRHGECQYNMTSMGEQLLRCRQTVLFGQHLCECKQFLLLSRDGRPLIDLPSDRVREELIWSSEERARVEQEVAEEERDQQEQERNEDAMPAMPVPPKQQP